MSFMKPQFDTAEYWEIETNHGTEIVPCDVQDWDGKFPVRKNEVDCFHDYFLPYLEGNEIESAERKRGILWRLSAPGYLDCTEWNAAETIESAVADCLGLFGDTFDLGDYEILASELTGFDEFWTGYLEAARS